MEDSRGGRPEDEDIIVGIQSGLQSLQLDSADNVEDKVHKTNIEDSRGGRPEDEDIIGEIQSGMCSLQLDSAEQEVKPEAVILDKIAEQGVPCVVNKFWKGFGHIISLTMVNGGMASHTMCQRQNSRNVCGRKSLVFQARSRPNSSKGRGIISIR